MKKKFNLNEKLLKYSAMGAGAIGITPANSQVVHVDINPDTLLDYHMEHFLMDMDGDAVNDFDFFMYNLQTSSSTSSSFFSYDVRGGIVRPASSNSNGWVATTGTGSSWPVNLSAGGPVNNAQNFGAGSYGVLGAQIKYFYSYGGSTSMSTYMLGEFLGTEGYIGVVFDISGQTHYGWVRVEVDAEGDSLWVKEYAYNTQPDETINAGQTVGVDELKAQNVIIRSSPEQIQISNYAGLNNGVVEVYDLSGKLMEQLPVSQNGTTQFNTGSLATGVYFVNVRFDEGLRTKKIYVR